MKSILMSIRPEWVAKILNKEKTVEVRKRFLKDYKGWVYIYCTKDPRWELDNGYEDGWFLWDRKSHHYPFKYAEGFTPMFNGKVVARFWCDKVEEIVFNGFFCPNDNEYTTKTMSGKELMKASCLDLNTLVWYLEKNSVGNIGKQVAYAIHISKLEVFYPREIITFKTSEKATPPKTLVCQNCGTPMEYYKFKYLKRSPQSWQWIEEE